MVYKPGLATQNVVHDFVATESPGDFEEDRAPFFHSAKAYWIRPCIFTKSPSIHMLWSIRNTELFC